MLQHFSQTQNINKIALDSLLRIALKVSRLIKKRNFILAFGSKQNMSVLAKLKRSGPGRPAEKNTSVYEHVFTSHNSRLSYGWEAFLAGPSWIPPWQKNLPLRRNRKCVGADFSHSARPVGCNKWLAVFSCFANESTQRVSRLLTADQADHTWAILSLLTGSRLSQLSWSDHRLTLCLLSINKCDIKKKRNRNLQVFSIITVTLQ